jgi:quinol monooxygenase YgiN
MQKSDSSDRFIMLREDAAPDVLWNIEVFRSIDAKEAYETSDMADELRDEIIDLLVEPPVRIEAHPTPPSPPFLVTPPEPNQLLGRGGSRDSS